MILKKPLIALLSASALIVSTPLLAQTEAEIEAATEAVTAAETKAAIATEAKAKIEAEIEAEIEARIQKIGTINISDVAITTSAKSGGIDAAALYQANCFACHGTGAAGAPKLGDVEEWTKRTALGEEVLVAGAINGIGAMPAKGGNASLSDAEIRAIVKHIISSSQ